MRQQTFFLFRRDKSELDGLSLSQDVFRTSCSGVIGTIAKNEFDNAFRQWMDRCQKYVRISCDKAKKRYEIMVFLKRFRIKVISPCAFVSDHTTYPSLTKMFNHIICLCTTGKCSELFQVKKECAFILELGLVANTKAIWFSEFYIG
jgi:hypothetical protein